MLTREELDARIAPGWPGLIANYSDDWRPRTEYDGLLTCDVCGWHKGKKPTIFARLYSRWVSYVERPSGRPFVRKRRTIFGWR